MKNLFKISLIGNCMYIINMVARSHFNGGSNYLLVEVLSKILSIKFQTGKTNEKNDNMKTLVNYQNGFVLITL